MLRKLWGLCRRRLGLSLMLRTSRRPWKESLGTDWGLAGGTFLAEHSLLLGSELMRELHGDSAKQMVPSSDGGAPTVEQPCRLGRRPSKVSRGTTGLQSWTMELHRGESTVELDSWLESELVRCDGQEPGRPLAGSSVPGLSGKASFGTRGASSFRAILNPEQSWPSVRRD